MNNKQKRFFNIAKEVAQLSDFKRTAVGAVVVEGKRIISTGHNSNKTSTTQYRYNKYRNIKDVEKYSAKIHAEVDALTPLLKENYDCSHASIYIYRKLKDGSSSCARPCAACMRLIKDLGIKTIYYTDWDEGFVKEEIL